jgi:hypothetical protein
MAVDSPAVLILEHRAPVVGFGLVAPLGERRRNRARDSPEPPVARSHRDIVRKVHRDFSRLAVVAAPANIYSRQPAAVFLDGILKLVLTDRPAIPAYRIDEIFPIRIATLTATDDLPVAIQPRIDVS